MPIRDHNPSGTFPLVTLGLITINILVFLFELTLPETGQSDFISRFALVPSQISFSNLGTLLPFLTSMFLHGSLLHLLSNMLFLWVFGDNIEAALGSFVYLIYYLLGGVIATLTQFVFISGTNVPLLGASGAIAAVLGGYLLLFPKAKIDIIIPIFFLPAIVAVPAFIMLGYWFFLQILSGFITILEPVPGGGVAFMAHAGGFVFGVLMIRLFSNRKAKYPTY